MSEVTAEMDGADVIELFNAMAEGLLEAINDELEVSAGIVAAVMRENAPEGVGGEGGLKGSIALFPDPEAMTVDVKPTVPYGDAIETGSRPHMPPVDALTAWAALKGLNPWAVAYSIKKFGTTANPYIAKTFDETAPEASDSFAEGIQLFLTRLQA
jgi:hypothetical protein